jgi:hypothetical protein
MQQCVSLTVTPIHRRVRTTNKIRITAVERPCITLPVARGGCRLEACHPGPGPARYVLSRVSTSVQSREGASRCWSGNLGQAGARAAGVRSRPDSEERRPGAGCPDGHRKQPLQRPVRRPGCPSPPARRPAVAGAYAPRARNIKAVGIARSVVNTGGTDRGPALPSGVCDSVIPDARTAQHPHPV